MPENFNTVGQAWSVLRRELALSRFGIILLMVALVTLMHYNTAMHIHAAHGIYRRLYYFPIIIAAFRGGRRAGLLTALLTCVVYIPHAFGLIGFDPAPTLEKVLEMILYLAVGLVCGVLVDRETRIRVSLELAGDDLRRTLTEKSAMAKQLVQAARLAAVGQLSAGLAHEIRNPLASIKGTADILADDFPDEHPKGRLLRILQAETRRLNEVLTRFLAYARPTSRQDSQVNLSEEINTVVDLVRHDHRDTTIKVDLPATAVMMVGDSQQIHQLLLNLLLNAALASGPGGRISVSLLADETHVQCLIQDSGPGFTPAARQNFGTPFFSTREGGTGLGLAMCVRVAEDHGGSITVDEEQSDGARVVVQLPRQPEVS